jgi:hypothetical protein
VRGIASRLAESERGLMARFERLNALWIGVALCIFDKTRPAPGSRCASRLRDRGGDRLVNLAQRIGVAHLGDVPAVGLEAFADVLGELDVGSAFEGDVIAVVKDRKLAQAEMQAAGERCRLAANPLHDVAFAAKREGAVVDDVETGLVEPRRQHALGHRHPYGVREPLTERPRGPVQRRVGSPSPSR